VHGVHGADDIVLGAIGCVGAVVDVIGGNRAVGVVAGGFGSNGGVITEYFIVRTVFTTRAIYNLDHVDDDDYGVLSIRLPCQLRIYPFQARKTIRTMFLFLRL
jgi:hypothetical protein